MLLSVIVTTYNRPDALLAVLRALRAQRGDSPSFEVLVADDGSVEPTRHAVESMMPSFRGSLAHVWQPDEGFRAGTIRNRAAARAKGDLLVFLDGDCIPRPSFVAGHAAAATPRCMIRGSRALLSEAFTLRVLEQAIPVHAWSDAAWVAARLRKEVNRLSGLLSLPWSRRVGRPRREWRSVRTCNLAMSRADFERLNGFDERYVGWGYEDSDLAIRGLNDGLRVRRAGPACTVLHLWHRENDRRFEGENLRRLESTERSGAIRAERGLDEARASAGQPAEGAAHG